jgi:hypothetical protein
VDTSTNSDPHPQRPTDGSCVDPFQGRIINLEAIELALHAVAQDYGQRDLRFAINCMLSGYAFIADLIDRKVDLFAIGNSRLFLELNARVLCGDETAVRKDSASHLKANEEYFYENETGGIRDVMDWHAIHQDAPIYRRAAGVYIRILSEPQLFIEGNHRTGALVMSYMLVREGRPPFVRTAANLETFEEWSNLFNSRKKAGPWLRWEMPWLTRRFGKFLEAQEDRQFLKGTRADAQHLGSGIKKSI